MWNNNSWAAKHISKHSVKPEKAWEVFRFDPSIVIFVAPEQLRYPPFKRYWTIGKTLRGRILIVVWERHKAEINLITTFEPNSERIALYERKKRQK